MNIASDKIMVNSDSNENMDINSPKRAHSLEGNLITSNTATPMEENINNQTPPTQQQINSIDSPFRPLCSSSRTGQMNLSTQSLANLFPSSINDDYNNKGGIEGLINNNNNNEKITNNANNNYGSTMSLNSLNLGFFGTGMTNNDNNNVFQQQLLQQHHQQQFGMFGQQQNISDNNIQQQQQNIILTLLLNQLIGSQQQNQNLLPQHLDPTSLGLLLGQQTGSQTFLLNQLISLIQQQQTFSSSNNNLIIPLLEHFAQSQQTLTNNNNNNQLPSFQSFGQTTIPSTTGSGENFGLNNKFNISDDFTEGLRLGGGLDHSINNNQQQRQPPLPTPSVTGLSTTPTFFPSSAIPERITETLCLASDSRHRLFDPQFQQFLGIVRELERHMFGTNQQQSNNTTTTLSGIPTFSTITTTTSTNISTQNEGIQQRKPSTPSSFIF
ncbi:DM domain-containing protein [Meloidogyne graminicola]|uniref:DM domain-containing protein n=1 Tax=Meloidogyne graminicola TaxID=189291 RepID=A0A8S9ZX17_9BILA|nr:DM domain-containing protein [Meloidogyne graminicola]